MPVTRFFALLKAGRRLHAVDLAKQCDIAFIPNATIKYYEGLKESCLAQAQGERFFEEIEKVRARASLQPGQAPNVFEAGSQEAKYAVMSIFAAKKGAGHG